MSAERAKAPRRPPNLLRPSRSPFLYRILAAMILRRELYEDVAADRYATGPAIAVVCVSAVVRHVLAPSAIMQIFQEEGIPTWGVLVIILLSVVFWLLFATLVFGIATLLAGGPVGYPRLLRCLGFAEAPSLLGVIPFAVGGIWFVSLRIAVWFWLLAATIVAVRAALAVTTARAAAISSLGFAMYIVLDLATRG